MNSKLKERANAKGITQVQTFDISSDTLVPISCTDSDERSSRLDLVRTDVAYDSFELQVQTCPITGTNTKTDSSETSHRDREFGEVSGGVELDISELSCEAMFEMIFDVFMINSSESLKEWQKRNRLRFSKCLTEWQKRNAIRFTKPEPSQLCDIEAQKESSNLASIIPDPNSHSLSSSIEPSYGEGSVINEETRDAGRVKVLRGGILREGHSSRVDRDDQGIPLGAQHQDGRPDQERNGQDWDQHQHACRIGREMQGPRDSDNSEQHSQRNAGEDPQQTSDGGTGNRFRQDGFWKVRRKDVSGSESDSRVHELGQGDCGGAGLAPTSTVDPVLPIPQGQGIGSKEHHRLSKTATSSGHQGLRHSLESSSNQGTTRVQDPTGTAGGPCLELSRESGLRREREHSEQNGVPKGDSSGDVFPELHPEQFSRRSRAAEKHARKRDARREQRQHDRCYQEGTATDLQPGDSVHGHGRSEDSCSEGDSQEGVEVKIALMANTESHAERALALKSARKIFADTDCTEEYSQLVRSGDRFDLCEICCSPNSILSEVCLGLGGKAFRINLANGFNLSTRHGIENAKAWVRRFRPKEAWVSLPCTLWSSMQNLTPLTPERQTKLAAQRKGARRMIRLVIELVELLVQLDCDPVWEWPLRATSWNLPETQKLLKLLPFKSRPDGCAFGMKAADVDEFVLKSWRLQCRTEEQAQRLNLQCQRNHLHVPIEGTIRTNATASIQGKWHYVSFEDF